MFVPLIGLLWILAVSKASACIYYTISVRSSTSAGPYLFFVIFGKRWNMEHGTHRGGRSTPPYVFPIFQFLLLQKPLLKTTQKGKGSRDRKAKVKTKKRRRCGTATDHILLRPKMPYGHLTVTDYILLQ